MAKPQIIKSPLSRVVEEGGVSVDVRICRLDNTGWSLEIVAEDGTSTVWDDLFSDEIALAEALNRLKEVTERSEKRGRLIAFGTIDLRAWPRPAKGAKDGSEDTRNAWTGENRR
jgi:hypothetical protein